jgi:hypothetical protein
MKELMRLYLDENYNSVHRKKTKFGIVTLDNHGYIYLGDITTSLSNVFSIDRESAFNIVSEWIETRDIVNENHF